MNFIELLTLEHLNTLDYWNTITLDMMSFIIEKTERKEIVSIDCGNMIYNKYKHPGISDENITLHYGMDDEDLDKLIFTNYQ